MSPATVLLALAAFGLAVGAVPAAATSESEIPAEDKCAPPCGYIYPTIGLDATNIDKPVTIPTDLPLPDTITIDVRYYWDMEQDGTGLPGDTEEMTITVALTKKPDWVTASVEPATCSFTLLPHVNEYDVCTVDLKVTVDEEPTSEQYIEDFGKRLMLFATSRESGMFKKSYGVEDIRFEIDDQAGAALDGATEAIEESPSPVVPLVVVGVAALAAARRRWA